MLLVRLAAGVALAYAGLALLAWLFQERMAFPAPRTPLPDPAQVGVAGERVILTTRSGTRVVGWFVPAAQPGVRPALLWFYGNGETIGDIWSVLREFQPPGTALLVLDYPGYGGSEGRTTERGLYEMADAAYAFLRTHPDVDASRIYAYGRSLGSAVASYTASRYPVAGLVLESPFTSARGMSRQHYGLFPRWIVRLGLDNEAHVARVEQRTLIFHGTADRLVPPAMGRAVAAAAAGPVELVLIEGAGHNDTYDAGGAAYRDKLWEFVSQPGTGTAREPSGGAPAGG